MPLLRDRAEPRDAVDPLATGSVVANTTQKPTGWTTVNGTKVVMREGETVYNLSRRFGVPASEILRANGIDKAGSVRSGQELIIPSYNYSAEAPVSAPDATPEPQWPKARAARF
ncbi:MAG: LysM peptidoglycan-binding domain-containing protein [Phyllobacteriaceae bacterium]|nr:LysM peptidoglycan-binding domain-containing protein [Phyllobacteriaceae bacterium]